jgi:glycosyltransferase involved in cell wall biosynthesis
MTTNSNNQSTVTVQVVQHLAPGGIETMALDLQRFAQDADNSYIISIEGTKEQLIAKWPRLEDRADRIICLEKPPGLSWQTIRQLTDLFKKLKPKVVHTHHIGPLLYGGIAARRAGVDSIVHTEHDAWHLQSAKRRFLAKLLLRIVKPVLVADAHMVAAEMVKQLNISPPVVIQNGIDTERFTPGDRQAARDKFNLPQDAIIIGCAARLIAVKGHKTLLAAMKAQAANVHLALAGQGEEEQSLKQFVADELDGAKIHFLGNIDDMPSFYQAIDIFCLPSFKEGFPLSPLEAQSAGVPVVASDTGGMKETLCPATGKLVTAGNVEDLSQTLNSVVAQLGVEEQRLSLSQSIRDFVTNNNDVRLMASRYHALS